MIEICVDRFDLFFCSLIALCFKLIPIQDKPMRQLIYSHIVNDIKNSNAKKHDPKMNNALQNLMFENISDPNELVARKTLDILVHLYNKKIWYFERIDVPD